MKQTSNRTSQTIVNIWKILISVHCFHHFKTPVCIRQSAKHFKRLRCSRNQVTCRWKKHKLRHHTAMDSWSFFSSITSSTDATKRSQESSGIVIVALKLPLTWKDNQNIYEGMAYEFLTSMGTLFWIQFNIWILISNINNNKINN